MKILFITDLYPIRKAEKNTPLTLHNFVFEWIKQGHKVEVIKPNFLFNSFLRGKPFYTTGFYDYEGVRIFNANYFTPFLFNFLDKIPNEIKFADYDVVIAHMPSGIIFANKMAHIMRKPLVCGVHCSDIEVLTNSLYEGYFRNQLKEAYKSSKKIACRSFVLQKKFNEILPEFAKKTFVASSGIEVKSKKQKAKSDDPTFCLLPFAFGSENHSLFTSHFSLLTCANLIKRKNIDKLILAVNNLEGFKLSVIGEGIELEDLKKLQSKKVNFLGRLPHEEVLNEMQKADIFVLPSVNETFGMVYLEAMASGCITVCTNNDGVDGIIKDSENGFLTEPTAEGIKETLLRIKNFEHKQTLIENSINTVKSYTAEICAQNYLKDLI